MTSTNARMFLWLGLVLALWINYETWQRDYAVPAPVTPATTSSAPLANVPTASIPQAAAPAASAKSTATTTLAAAPATAAGTAAGTVRVTTDVLDLELSLRGGDLVRADLLKYPRVKGGEERVRLFNDDANHFYFLQTGLTDTNGAAHPTHLALFESAQTRHALAEGAAELRVPLTWVDAATGVSVTKTYILRRGSYRIDLEYAIEKIGRAHV